MPARLGRKLISRNQPQLKGAPCLNIVNISIATKTHRQPCKRVTGPIIPALVCKSVSPMDVITRRDSQQPVDPRKS